MESIKISPTQVISVQVDKSAWQLKRKSSYDRRSKYEINIDFTKLLPQDCKPVFIIQALVKTVRGYDLIPIRDLIAEEETEFFGERYHIEDRNLQLISSHSWNLICTALYG